jgi:hypothetical protein
MNPSEYNKPTRPYFAPLILTGIIVLIIFAAWAASCFGAIAVRFRSIDAATCIDCLRGINGWRH